jgi:hypothetical protein
LHRRRVGKGLEKGLSLDPCAISGTLLRFTGPSAGPFKIAKGYEERGPLPCIKNLQIVIIPSGFYDWFLTMMHW